MFEKWSGAHTSALIEFWTTVDSGLCDVGTVLCCLTALISTCPPCVAVGSIYDYLCSSHHLKTLHTNSVTRVQKV